MGTRDLSTTSPTLYQQAILAPPTVNAQSTAQVIIIRGKTQVTSLESKSDSLFKAQKIHVRRGGCWCCWLVLWAQSTTKDYIRAERELHSVSKISTSQVIIPQVMFFFWAYLYSACTQHGNLPPSAGRHMREPCVSHSLHRKNIGRGFGKQMQVNGPEGLEISKEEIAGRKRSMYGYILTYSRF